MKELQAANENKQQELETVRKKLEEAASRAAEEEKKRLQTQVELQARFSTELEREKLVSTTWLGNAAALLTEPGQ